MSKSGQAYIAKEYGTEYTLYSICRALGIPLSPEQEEYQRYLESIYPKEVNHGDAKTEETNGR